MVSAHADQCEEILSLSARFQRIDFWLSSDESPLTVRAIARDANFRARLEGALGATRSSARLGMRCVGACAFRYQNPVAVPRRFLLFQFARNDLSKIPQMVFGALRVADRLLSGSCGSFIVGAGRRARSILSVSALTVLTSACANAPPEVASWQFTTVSFDRTDPPQAPYGEKPSSGWRTIVSGPAATRQSTSAAGWRTEVIPYETEWP